MVLFDYYFYLFMGIFFFFFRDFEVCSSYSGRGEVFRLCSGIGFYFV